MPDFSRSVNGYIGTRRGMGPRGAHHHLWREGALVREQPTAVSVTSSEEKAGPVKSKLVR